MATAPHPLADPKSLQLSHLGFYTRDLNLMARFYQEVLGFTETDRGNLGPVQLIFLSRDPTEHHQLVLASGRPADANYRLINQISFRVADVATLKLVHRLALAHPGVSDMQPASHGNAISIYFRDPEDNRIEVFFDTPWYCEQPVREPVDMSASDEQIMADCQALAKSRPKFASREQWLADLAKKILPHTN